jgi:hypothetical protein
MFVRLGDCLAAALVCWPKQKTASIDQFENMIRQMRWALA